MRAKQCDILRRDFSEGDLSVSYKLNNFTCLKMACLKSLTGYTNQAYRKTHSFSEDFSTTQGNQMYCNCLSLSGKSSISSPFIFNSYQSKLDTVPLLPFLKPAKSNRDLFGSESCCQDINMDSWLQNLKNSVDSIYANIMPVPTVTDNSFIRSAVTDFNVDEMPSFIPQNSLDETTTSKPMNPPVSENTSSQGNATMKSTFNSTVLNETLQSSNTDTPVASSSIEDSINMRPSDSDVTVESSQLAEMSLHCQRISDSSADKCCSHKSSCSSCDMPVASFSIGDSNIACSPDSGVTVESSQSAGMLPHHQHISDSSAEKCCSHKSSSSSPDTHNHKKVMQSKLTPGNSSTPSALKPILNLTSVLSAPRKTAKKGRPSSRKQKKRQREKQKRGLQTKETLDSTDTGCDTEQKHHSPSTEFVCSQGNKKDISPCKPKFETSHEVFKPKCQLTHLFVRLMSCSEDENIVEDDGDQCKIDTSAGKHKEVSFPSIKGFGFGCALDLDTIFKKTGPKGSVNTHKKQEQAFCNDNGFQKNTYQSLSQCGSLDKSSNISTRPVLKDAESCFFTPALSLDHLFCKKSTSCSQAAVDQGKTRRVDLLDDSHVSSDDNIDHLPTDSEAASETLEKINTLWNEHYPTAGLRSCSTVSADEIEHEASKVHFAAEPHFLTVHIVGTEDRNGNWHHVIREREHFEKRIQELGHILSPFLETSHRAKALEQRNSQ